MVRNRRSLLMAAACHGFVTQRLQELSGKQGTCHISESLKADVVFCFHLPYPKEGIL